MKEKTMNQYIALLRAINVGGRFIKMDELRQLFESLGFSQVQTYIQSGNVVFTTDATDPARLEQTIEQHLQGALSYEVSTMIRTPAAMVEIAAYQPFPEEKFTEKSTLYISFLKEEPGQDKLEKLDSFNSDIDEFHPHGRQLYWLMHKHQGQSKFTNSKLEKVLGIPATRRNSSTVRKIVAKYFGDIL
jgi:uncharacterized protein (DUF1697 family)